MQSPSFISKDGEDFVASVPRWLRAMVGASDRTEEEVAEDRRAGWPTGGFDSMIFSGVRDIRVERGRFTCIVPVTKQMLVRVVSFWSSLVCKPDRM
jgi:hypothetical protein